MEKLNVNQFENHLKFYDLTRSEIEKMCLSPEYPLYFYPKDYNDPAFISVENAKLPMFVSKFYMSVDNRKGINQMFTQKAFWNYYKQQNPKYFSRPEIANNPNLFQKMEGRIFRVYPSLVRDLHFLMYLKERHGIENVLYNPELDAAIGIDVLLKDKGKVFGIKLLIESERSEKYKNLKDKFRQQSYENIEFIVIPKQLDNNKFGDFFLYGDAEYNKFIAPLVS